MILIVMQSPNDKEIRIDIKEITLSDGDDLHKTLVNAGYKIISWQVASEGFSVARTENNSKLQ